MVKSSTFSDDWVPDTIPFIAKTNKVMLRTLPCGRPLT